MPQPHQQQGERGIAALSLLTVAILLGLGIIVAMALPLTEASDDKAKSRSAADAAALAGADWVRLELKEQLSIKGWLGGFGNYPLLDQGLAAATAYAQKNDSTLVSYQPPTLGNNWTASVRVEDTTVDGERFTSEAEARFDLPDCQEQPAASDDDEPPTDPGEEPPPPEPTTVDCGDIEFEVPGEGPPLIDIGIIEALFEDSNAKLIS